MRTGRKIHLYSTLFGYSPAVPQHKAVIKKKCSASFLKALSGPFLSQTPITINSVLGIHTARMDIRSAAKVWMAFVHGKEPLMALVFRCKDNSFLMPNAYTKWCILSYTE